jgi:hypothetical protein
MANLVGLPKDLTTERTENTEKNHHKALPQTHRDDVFAGELFSEWGAPWHRSPRQVQRILFVTFPGELTQQCANIPTYGRNS